MRPRSARCHLVVCCLQEGAEFIAAETKHRFKVVQIQHQNHQSFLVPLRLGAAPQEFLLQPVAQWQTGQRGEPRAVRQVRVLQERPIGDDVGLRALEAVELARVTDLALEDAPADAARNVVHLPVAVVPMPDRHRIELIEALAVALRPVAEATTAVRVLRQHVLARRAAQHRTAQHPARPCHVALHGFVEFQDEVLGVVVAGARTCRDDAG